jgi:recombinational DNA repair protein (RecF pathway)
MSLNRFRVLITKKGPQMGKPLDPFLVKKAMYENGYELLEEFENTKKPILAKHLKCGEVVVAKYYTVLRGQESCKKCRNKKIKIDDAEAVALMVSHNLQPLVPYSYADTKWPCICMICGDYCEPAYSWVKRGQGGCMNCAKDSKSKKVTAAHAAGRFHYTKTLRSEDEAIEIMLKADRVPLEPYKNTRSKWLSKCLVCGTQGSPTLHLIIRRGNQCKTCGLARTANSNKFSQDEAKRYFEMGGVELLEPYSHDNSLPMKSRCMRCGKLVYPTMGNIRRTKEGCKYCAGVFVHPDDAKKLMISFGYEPVEPYKGTDTPWNSIHINCGSRVKPTYGTIKRGGGGCPNCADWGFAFDKPSYVYVVTNSSLNAHKVGIANVAKQKKSDRLHRLNNHGWEVVQRWDFAEGAIALKIEAEVFKVIRKDLAIPQFLEVGIMKYGGETETMDANLIDLTTLIGIVSKAVTDTFSN